MNRCYICNGLAQDYCALCGKSVCSRCIDDNICMYCKEGVRIGYTPLKNIVNPILFVGGIAVIIVGIILMSLSFIPDKIPKNGGFIYIFPFPFLFVSGSSELSILIPLIMLILLPLLFFIFMKILKYQS